MELNLITFRLLFFSLVSSFIIVTHAKLYLDRSDYNAFIIVQRNLGIDAHHTSFTTTPCNSHAITCERRVTNYTSILKITRVVYDSEQLDGSISPATGQLQELRELSLTNNHLVQQLPKEIVGCRKLEVLNLKNNRFSGNVPPELSKLVRLRVLDLSSNRFSGDLSFLRNFPNLESLSLADNLFAGKIPASVKLFRNLKLFDISGNDYVQGHVPELKGVKYISSEVSKSIVPRRFVLAQNSTPKGHNTFGGNRTARVPVPAPAPTRSAPVHNHHISTKRRIEWAMGFIVGTILGVIAGLIFSFFVKMALILIRGRPNSTGVSLFSPLIKKAEDLAFLEKEDGLDNLEEIGSGGCGKVYKAQVEGSNGKVFAIKKIIQSPKDVGELSDEDSKALNKKLRQIRSEINTVGRIRHRNILPLVAHVSRPDCHLLVYEYMGNGSLQDKMKVLAEERTEFDWLARFKVALGVASGLEYLHMNSTARIIHRDLKPGNILLDDDMEPRISDFGLAKEMPLDNTHMSSSNIAGTRGYIAPEYYQTSKYTDKSDIYSLGVVLGGLVMGKLPYDQFFQETDEMCLVKWMRNVMISEEPKRALDPKLIGNCFEEQMLQVLKVACFCTAEDPKQRPNSKDVRCMLFQITNTNQLLTKLSVQSL